MTGTETFTITTKDKRGFWQEQVKGILNLFDRLDEIDSSEHERIVCVTIE